MMNDSGFSVQLTFSGRNLKDLDILSKSDPFLRFSMQKSQIGNIIFIGKTETIANNVNPNWVAKLQVDYYFEMQQSVMI